MSFNKIENFFLREVQRESVSRVDQKCFGLIANLYEGLDLIERKEFGHNYLIYNDSNPMVGLSDDKRVNIMSSFLKFIKYFSHCGHSSSLEALVAKFRFQIRK